MAYIGKEPIVGNFQKCDAITVVNGQAAYTLQVSSTNVVPESANHMLVSLNGILQAPVTSFTVSGSTLTFASNLATGDVIDFVILLGNVLDLGVPSDDTVGAAQIKDDLISGTTALASEPADTDELLVSDAGTLKRLDYSLIKGSTVNIQSTLYNSRVTQSISANTITNITGLSVAITPTSTSSKILILARFMGECSQEPQDKMFGINRGTTYINEADTQYSSLAYGMMPAAISYGAGDNNDSTPESCTIMTVDSPSTTSSTTYYMTFHDDQATTLYINRMVTDTHERGSSEIIAIEIK